jgi:hypothetical protein
MRQVIVGSQTFNYLLKNDLMVEVAGRYYYTDEAIGTVEVIQSEPLPVEDITAMMKQIHVEEYKYFYLPKNEPDRTFSRPTNKIGYSQVMSKKPYNKKVMGRN